MESEVKELGNLKLLESDKTNGIEQDVEESCEIKQEPSEETTDKSGIADSNNHIISNDNEIFNGSNDDNQQQNDDLNEIKCVEIKQESDKKGQSDIDKRDNQDADEEEEEEEEEVEDKDEDADADKVDKDKSSQGQDNQDGLNFDGSSFLGRNRRVRQKNRYFLDFHCIDLTKGARSNRDDYDAFTTSTGTRSSNRRSTTDSNRGQDEPEVFESRYCRKCLNKTPHDIDGGCQACLYKKIVESSKRQRPANHKNRSGNSRQQRDNEVETSSSTTNTNKRKATKQGGSKSSNNNIINNNTITTTTTISNNNNNNINTTNNTINSNIINNSNKLPRLDSWSPDEVAEYILSKGFAHEAELFKTQSVDGISLLLMQRTDFTYGLKIKLGPALKIYDQVCKLKKEYFRTVTTST